jgi:hypothetical protein
MPTPSTASPAPITRPKTRGELARRLQAGETCEVAGHVAEMTAIILRGWLKTEGFQIFPSSNTGWVLFQPEAKKD